MNIIVSAEFDSVDLADLARGKLKHISGIKSCETEKNNLAKEGDSRDFYLLTPAAPFSSGNYYPGFGSASLSVFYGIGDLYDDTRPNKNIEPSQRRNARLYVITDNEDTAKHVSAVLRNIGGLNVQIYKK